jgi:LuxR family maltose regulon positive regulatory protein
MLENAVHHALAGRQLGRAADLVEAALPEFRRSRRNRVLRSWLGALPESEVRTRPVLSAVMAWTRLVAGDLDGVEGWLDDAERAFKALPLDAPMASDELRTLPAWISIHRASAAQARDDVTGTAAHARHALELAGPEDHLAIAGAAGFLGLSAWGAVVVRSSPKGRRAGARQPCYSARTVRVAAVLWTIVPSVVGSLDARW